MGKQFSWTPRYRLLQYAKMYRRENKCSGHVALESVVALWRQNKTCAASCDYYHNATYAAIKRLSNEVEKGV